jgi:hypothetical protein
VAELAPGTRVRVAEPVAGRLVGTVTGVQGDMLLLFSGQRVHSLPISSIRAVQVSGGFSSRPASAVRGGAVGLLTGAAGGAAAAVLAGLVMGDGECGGGGDLLCFNTGEWALVGAMVGAPVGAVSGAAFGFAFPRERWRSIGSGAPPRLTLRSQSGGLRAGLTLSAP